MVTYRGLPDMLEGAPVITYLANGGGERIFFSAGAISRMLAHRQLSAGDAEAGGQLFARISEGQIDVEVATGPNRADRRSRFYFAPSRVHERRDIRNLHRCGLHYVGDWHTHPQPVPSPSDVDLRNINEIFKQSRHSYAGILIVILGQLEPPAGLYVGIANGEEVDTLLPLPIAM